MLDYLLIFKCAGIMTVKKILGF